MEIRLNIANAESLSQALRRFPEETRAAMTAAMYEATAYIEARIKSEAPAATGLYRDSWYSTVNVLSEGITGVVGTSSSYAIPVELGSKPHMPPIEPIADWVGVKLGVSDPVEQENIAWGIAMKIKKHGTEGTGTVQKIASDSDTERTYNAIIAKHLQRLIGG